LRLRRIVTIVIASGWLGCLSLLSGCGDDSKTTGTQLQLSPEDKAFIEQQRGVRKGARQQESQERPADPAKAK
jgi:hypothetical protein